MNNLKQKKKKKNNYQRHMQINFFLIVLTILLSLMHECSTTSTTIPTWLTSPYLRAGNQQVVKVSSGKNVVTTYVFTFSSPLTNIPKLGYGIKAYEGGDQLGQEQFLIQRVDLNKTNFKVKVQIQGNTIIRILNVAYLAVQPTFPHHLNTFDNIPVNYSSGNIVNISESKNQELKFTEVINYTSQASALTHKRFMDPINSNKILLLTTTLSIFGDWTANSNGVKGVLYPIQFTITPAVLNYEEYSIEVKTYRMMRLTRLHFSQVIFNYNDVRSSNKYQLTFEVWQSGFSGFFHEIPIQFKDNFMLGLLDFSTIYSKCTIVFQWDFAVENFQNGVRVGLLPNEISNCSLQSMRLAVFYMRTWQCPASHPYYTINSKFCQNECQTRYYQDTVQLICYECDQSRCLQCTQDLYTCIKCHNDSFLLNNGTCRQSYCPNYSQIASSQYDIMLTQLDKAKDRNQATFYVQINQVEHTVPNISSHYINSHKDEYSQLADINYTLYKDYISIPSLNTSFFGQNLTLITSFTYKDDIQGMKIPFNYAVKLPFQIEDGQICFKELNFSVQVKMQTNNNVPVTFQTPKQLQQKRITQAIITTIACFSLGFLLIGFLLSAKIVGLEHLGVLQLAFFSLSDYQKINSDLSPLADMKFLNGYNINFFQGIQEKSNQELPSRILGISYHSYFLENCNIPAILMVAFLLLGAIAFLLSKKITTPTKSDFMKKISSICIFDIGLTFLLFNLFNISFSTALHLKYARSSQGFQGYYIGSIIFMVICLLIPLIYFLGVIFSSFDQTKAAMGQFRDKFKPNFQCRNYVAFTILYRFCVAVYMASQTQYQLSTLIIIAFSQAFLIYNLINLPFKQAYHNYRAILCHVTHFCILFITMFYRSMKSNSPRVQVLKIKTPIYLQLWLLIFCTTISAVFLSYDAYKCIKAHLNKIKGNQVKNKIQITTQSNINTQVIQFASKNIQGQIVQINNTKKYSDRKKKLKRQQTQIVFVDSDNFAYKQNQLQNHSESSQNILTRINTAES